MAVQKIELEKFLGLAESFPVLDVRSPGEYRHAHIPGAHSFPLFTDEERAVVGTAYKQESREKAIKIGLAYFGKKMVEMVEQAEQILAASKNGNEHKTVLVHCWRGGMRSAGVAWLLDLYGFRVYTLAGGYKVFRRWALDQLGKKYPFRILGGYTGSGKTELLKELENKGEAIVDLEALASHKGSAFGALGMPKQPSQEMFENMVAFHLQKAVHGSGMDKPIWLEDESQRIGLVNIPQDLWKTMRESQVCFVDIPFEERLNHLVEEYGKLDKEKMIEAITRIQKRLGGLEAKSAIAFLTEGDTASSFRILLTYYDKQYKKGLLNRDNLNSLLQTIPCETVDAKQNAGLLLSALKEKTSIA